MNPMEDGMKKKGSFAGGLIAGGVVAAIAAYFLLARPGTGPADRSESTAPLAATTSVAPIDFSAAALSGVERISPDGLKDLMDRGEAAIIDVRDIDTFKAGHIPGALQIPLQYVAGETQYFPRDKKLITYCT